MYIKKSRHVHFTTVDWSGKQGTNKVNNEKTMRGIEWFLNKKWVWKIFAQSRNLGSICNGYQSLVFERICVSESRLFLTMGLVF